MHRLSGLERGDQVLLGELARLGLHDLVVERTHCGRVSGLSTISAQPRERLVDVCDVRLQLLDALPVHVARGLDQHGLRGRGSCGFLLKDVGERLVVLTEVVGLRRMDGRCAHLVQQAPDLARLAGRRRQRLDERPRHAARADLVGQDVAVETKRVRELVIRISRGREADRPPDEHVAWARPRDRRNVGQPLGRVESRPDAGVERSRAKITGLLD